MRRYEDQYLEKNKNTAHLSAYIISTHNHQWYQHCDEFRFMGGTYNFDEIPLSEMWLRNDSNILNYVKIPGYSFEYRNCLRKKGWGVSLYIKDMINSYKVRFDIIEM